MEAQDAPPETPAAKLAAGCLLTDVELAALYGVSLQTVRNWRWKGEGPRYVKLGARCIRYRPQDVQAFIDSGDAKVAA
ncbi:MAG TPA: helix-turn-helix domain-containing protein [Rhodanobacteraceae bacterium]|nr:helix-turn-helix domain-containing protein [Rhodanobacteraceae bacterium]